MEKQIKISNYSCYDNYTTTSKGGNWSPVVSKMVELAGRYCERFASDIFYDAHSLIRAIDENRNHDMYLFFRDSGVTALAPEHIESIDGTDFIQAWHLTYNAETEEQEFTRVNVYFERMW